MPQTKILLDTNAYRRLAQTIQPLLFDPFGKKEYTLYVIKEFQTEFNRQKRLTRIFPWVNQDFGSSDVDVRAVAVGYILSIPVVTDDKDMIDLARSLGVKGVKVMGILDLLAIMVESDHITHDKIKELVSYLHYHNDLPYKNFIRDINEKFGLDII